MPDIPDFSGSLVPKLCLGTPFLEAPASYCIPGKPSLGSWRFRDCVPNEDVGNERKCRIFPIPLVPNVLVGNGVLEAPASYFPGVVNVRW